MKWSRVVQGWKADAGARLALRQRLLDAGGDGVVWETAPSVDGGEPYAEWIGAKPRLARMRTNPSAFAEHLEDRVVGFPNLGGRSMLVSPPVTGDFGHLLSFARMAPDPLWHELWTETAVQVERWWAGGRGRLWVSTHGGGVPWLHVRLDPHPKYYMGPLCRAAKTPRGTRLD